MTLCTSTHSRSHRSLLLTAALTSSLLANLGGCGSGTADTPAPAASVGDEVTPAETSIQQNELASATTVPVSASSASRMPLPAAEVTGRGSIVVSATVNGQPVLAQVKVLDNSMPLEGSTGESITLPAGNQRISVTIADPKALLDRPTQNLSVYVEPSKPTPVEVTFRWSKVRLDVQVGGRSQGGVPVKLIRSGAVVAELKSGESPQAISPGKYEADVLLRGRTIHVTGLNFMESAEQTVPVRAQL